MDILELKQHYERLSDDELMRVWADREGVSELAVPILSEELRGRGLLDSSRVAVLRGELAETKRRYERGQRRIMRRLVAFAVVPVLVAIFVLVLWLLGIIH